MNIDPWNTAQEIAFRAPYPPTRTLAPVQALIACMILTLGGNLLAQGQGISRRFDCWGELLPETGFGIERCPDGYVVFLGSYYIDDSLLYSSVVSTLHIDDLGNPLDRHAFFQPFHTTYPGHANVSFHLPGGGLGVGGSRSDGGTESRPALFLFDQFGSPSSMFIFGVDSQYWTGRQGKATPDGGYVICGETSSSGTSLDAFLLKIDSTGAQEWVQTYGLPNKQEYMAAVDTAAGGGYYLGGQQESAAPGVYDQWVVRVDAQGDLIWDHCCPVNLMAHG